MELPSNCDVIKTKSHGNKVRYYLTPYHLGNYNLFPFWSFPHSKKKRKASGEL